MQWVLIMEAAGSWTGSSASAYGSRIFGVECDSVPVAMVGAQPRIVFGSGAGGMGEIVGQIGDQVREVADVGFQDRLPAARE